MLVFPTVMLRQGRSVLSHHAHSQCASALRGCTEHYRHYTVVVQALEKHDKCCHWRSSNHSIYNNAVGKNYTNSSQLIGMRISLYNVNNFTSWRKFSLSKFTLNKKSSSGEDGVAASAEDTAKSIAGDTADESSASAASRLKEAVIKKVLPRAKEKPLSMVSTDRNFITAVRAMAEFLLKPTDLENLRKTKRRSPFENEPRITVYWMKDVEKKAMEVWGSRKALERERLNREKELQRHKQNLFNMRRLLKNFQYPEPAALTTVHEIRTSEPPHQGMDDSGKVVYTAIIVNGVNFLLKFGAWLYTGSHCLFAEALHSLADTTNQIILAYGIHKSMQRADTEHPYGYSNMRYVSSLISGAMIFCVGAGLSVQHGIAGLYSPPEVVPLYWAFCILGGSLVTEGGTLLMAVHAIRKGAAQSKISFMEYVMKGEDPSVNVVLLEDTAAVLGVGVALSCLGLTSALGTTLPDALGSCIIGGILASVSGFIVYSNVAALVGRSIPQRDLEHMNRMMEQDVMIRALHDVKGIDMGTGLVRYKAEVDFDGRELTRAYLRKQNMETLLAEMNNLKTIEDAHSFLLNHGENIVDILGSEVDRIEQSLKKAHPEVRHCDLEIL